MGYGARCAGSPVSSRSGFDLCERSLDLGARDGGVCGLVGSVKTTACMRGARAFAASRVERVSRISELLMISPRMRAHTPQFPSRNSFVGCRGLQRFPRCDWVCNRCDAAPTSGGRSCVRLLAVAFEGLGDEVRDTYRAVYSYISIAPNDLSVGSDSKQSIS